MEDGPKGLAPVALLDVLQFGLFCPIRNKCRYACFVQLESELTEGRALCVNEFFLKIYLSIYFKV